MCVQTLPSSKASLAFAQRAGSTPHPLQDSHLHATVLLLERVQCCPPPPVGCQAPADLHQPQQDHGPQAVTNEKPNGTILAGRLLFVCLPVRLLQADEEESACLRR